MNIDDVGILHVGADGEAVVFPVEFATASGDVGKMTPALDGEGLPVKVSGLSASDDIGLLIPAADGEGLAVGYSEANPCADGEREMILSVVGPSGSANWCGETWTLPGDSGVEKKVCGVYVKEQAVSGYYNHAQERWNYASSLGMYRQYGININTTFWSSVAPAANRVGLIVSSYVDSIQFRGSGTPATRPSLAGWPSSYIAASSLGILSGADAATYNDYLLLSKQYQNTVAIGANSYSWRKGAGW